MKLLALCFAIAFCATQSVAAVFLRAGEHQSFTRFTLEIDNDINWELRAKADSFDIIFPGKEFDFDISEAYNRISRENVSSVSVTGESLHFKNSCNCQVTAGFASHGIFVIDVISDIGLYRSSSISIEDQSSKIEQNRSSFTKDLKGPRGIGHFESINELLNRDSPLENLKDGTFSKQTKYFFQPRDVFIRPIAQKYPSTQSNAITNLRIAPELERQSSIKSESNCVHYDPFQMLFESDVSSALSALPEKRKAVYTDLNRVSAEAVYELAELYAYLGLGSEIALLISQLNSQSPKSSFLLKLAGLFEHGSTSMYTVVPEVENCVTSTPFWSILTAREDDLDEHLTIRDVVQEFTQLPDHLKEILAPSLVERLIERKAYSAAQYVLRTVEILKGEIPEHLLYLRDKLNSLMGERDVVNRILYTVSQTNSTVAPTALADLIEKHTESGKSISEDLALLADSYAVQFRNSEEGPALNRARVIAQAKAGNFDDAIDLLFQSDSENLDTDELANLVTEIIVSEAGNVDFASLFYPQSPLMTFNISSSSARRVAQRYQQLGLTSLALAWTETFVSNSLAEDEDYFAALILYEKGEFQAALQALEHSRSRASSELRQKIWFHQGEYSRLANQPPSTTASQSVADASLIHSMNQNRQNFLESNFDASALETQQDYFDLITKNRQRIDQIETVVE